MLVVVANAYEYTKRRKHIRPGLSVDSFVVHWGLDDGAQRALMSLNPDTQRRVMDGFTPPPNTIKSISALFMGFARGFSNNSQRAQPY